MGRGGRRKGTSGWIQITVNRGEKEEEKWYLEGKKMGRGTFGYLLNPGEEGGSGEGKRGAYIPCEPRRGGRRGETEGKEDVGGRGKQEIKISFSFPYQRVKKKGEKRERSEKRGGGKKLS